MKKHYALGLVTAFVAALGLATAAPAMATDCVPKDAWVEHIDHPAVGEPKITVDNPDYQPATPDTTTTVHHDGTPDTTKVTGYMKWTWTAGHKTEPTTAPPSDGWHQVGITSDSKGNTPDTIIHQGNGYGSYFYFETQTKVTPGQPAWDETVTVPGKPAVGEPTIQIDNPDYKAAWTENVNHDAVYCPGPQPNAKIDYKISGGDLTCDGWTEQKVETWYTDYVLNEAGSEWVLGTPVLGKTEVFPGYEATWGEKAQIDCARPDEVAVFTTTSQPQCDLVGQTIQTTATTPWTIETFDNNGETLKKYVAGETHYDYVVLATTPKLDCPVMTPGPLPIDKSTPAAATTPSNTAVLASAEGQQLAQTGSNATWVPLVAIGAISLIAIVSFLMWFGRRRRSTQQ